MPFFVRFRFAFGLVVFGFFVDVDDCVELVIAGLLVVLTGAGEEVETKETVTGAVVTPEDGSLQLEVDVGTSPTVVV